VHDHDTRGRINNEIYVPPQTLGFSQQNLHSNVARLYKRLPVSIRVEPRFPQFVMLLKKSVYDHKFYDENECFWYMENL